VQDIPLPWERLLWSRRPAFSWLSRERYILTDLRLIRLAGGGVEELLLHDIADITRTESRLDRLVGASTLVVHPRDMRRAPIVLRRVFHGPQLAALLEWLSSQSGEPPAGFDAAAVKAAIAWNPQGGSPAPLQAVASLIAGVVLVFGVAIGLHGKTSPPMTYSPDDPIYPNGLKRTDAEIVRFMETEIMPWARATLGPLKGGSERIKCETCHGADPQSRAWRMPAVAALPQPDLRERGWELYGGTMDAQMRNAIYGYLAESDKQTKASYMREMVMPGMARLLRRPAYDFTQPYEYNRSRLAFGCYHCHRVN
jgi:cytochrome c553